MIISMIAAIGQKNRVLGKDNKLLWNIPEDTKFFREITKGHPVIMGRKTFESLGKPLPRRINIVITRDAEFKAAGAVIVNSIEEAIDKAKSFYSNNQDERGSGEDETFIIGGGQIYTQALKLADRLYLTIVQGNYAGDSFFPDYSQFGKVLAKRESEESGYKYTFLTLEK